ncbi:MAG TPA: RtcB family protein, partial [Planctomycetaceae bacterium]|nr:RtcB family protein [Planctomycetaceae bacterium]
MSKQAYTGPLEQISEWMWKIPRSYKPGMRVDGLIYSSAQLIDQLVADQAPEQVANVAYLPGIQKASLAMPDIHWGYGFTIGGVCATDPAEGGVISPGGVGYDINCGVRMVRTNLFYRDVKPRLQELVDELFEKVPAGTGRGGKYKFEPAELRGLLAEGPRALLERELACERDIEFTEARGKLEGADPDLVSERAYERGKNQCGTLGSGNHFLELQVVDAIFHA